MPTQILRGAPGRGPCNAHRAVAPSRRRAPACSHDTLAAWDNGCAVSTQREKMESSGQRVWERPGGQLLKVTAVPCGMAAAYFIQLVALSLIPRRAAPRRTAGIEPGLHGRTFPQYRGGKVMVAPPAIFRNSSARTTRTEQFVCCWEHCACVRAAVTFGPTLAPPAVRCSSHDTLTAGAPVAKSAP